jgi:putative ABC transport system substrate-binding protein
MARDRPDAILMVTDALTALNRKRVFEFAAEHKLPAIYEYDFLVRDGGLMFAILNSSSLAELSP